MLGVGLVVDVDVAVAPVEVPAGGAGGAAPAGGVPPIGAAAPL
jgi:hypothetical protein